jgi:hypothetical protein
MRKKLATIFFFETNIFFYKTESFFLSCVYGDKSNGRRGTFRAPLAGLRLWLKRLRLWLWQNNGFFGEAEAIL